MFLKAFFTLALTQLALAQDYGGGAPPANSASAAPAAAPSAPPDSPGHININVAPNNTFVFSPEKITANVGDLVTFYIPAGSIAHSVTQSSFDKPCTYLAANGSNPAGFDSHLQNSKTFTLNITDTKPIWFHCKQITHCGLGMVGSINAPLNGTNTHENFVAAAKALNGKEVTETDSGSPVLSGVGAVATSPPTDSTGQSQSGALRTIAGTVLYVATAGVAVLLI